MICGMSPRLALAILLAALWIGAPFVARHPLLEAAERWYAPPAPARLESVLDRVDDELAEEMEVALWWPERDERGLAALGHLWARAGYQLTPRRVYPLLTAEEARHVEPLHDAMRPVLGQRGAALVSGDLDRPVAVFSWGDDDCGLDQLPRLVVVMRDGPGCVLRPRAQILEVAP